MGPTSQTQGACGPSCPTYNSLHCSFIAYCDPTQKNKVTGISTSTGYTCCVTTADTYLPSYMQVCGGDECNAISGGAAVPSTDVVATEQSKPSDSSTGVAIGAATAGLVFVGGAAFVYKRHLESGTNQEDELRVSLAEDSAGL
jgi:hypothetical protein